MKRWSIGMTVLFCTAASALGQEKHPGEIEDFDLTPSVPTNSYWLLTDPRERLRGNAAVLYAEVFSLLDDVTTQFVNNANDAYMASDDARFDAAAAQLDQDQKRADKLQGLFELLEVAARRDSYSWDSSFDQQGVQTLLPQLNGERGIANLVRVRALQQIRARHFDDAIRSIRLEFELGQKVGSGEDTLVGGLVGNGIVAIAADATAELMKQPNSPNLYWALAALPRPMTSIRQAFFHELDWAQATFHELAPDRIASLSADDWRRIYRQALVLNQQMKPSTHSQAELMRNPKQLDTEVARSLTEARAYYARTYNISDQQLGALDSFKVVATYWYAQAEAELAQQYQLLSFPYPILIRQSERLARRQAEVDAQQPMNVFLTLVDRSIARPAMTWARAQRTIDALTDVEAIRSYAAVADGKLPDRLEDITDTPIFANPRTGEPFGYTVQGDTATLSDPGPAEAPLKYTIRIRQ